MPERCFGICTRATGCLDAIERALFAVCLDASSPESLEERFRAALHGDGINRWFDKSLQLVIGQNGHTAAESKVAALKRAAETHVTRMKECMAGMGVERHIFGL